MYNVFGESPLSIMEPVAVLQLVGFVKLVVVITGVGFITTLVDPVAEEQFPVIAVATTLYVPDAAVLTLAIVGFCTVLVKPLGPVQAHVTVPVNDVVAFSSSVLSLHTGVFEATAGVAGV